MSIIGKLLTAMPVAIGLGISAMTPEHDQALSWAGWSAIVGSYSAAAWILVKLFESGCRIPAHTWMRLGLVLTASIPFGFYGAMLVMNFCKTTDVLLISPIAYLLSLCGRALLPWVQKAVKSAVKGAATNALRGVGIRLEAVDDEDEQSREAGR